VKKIILFLSIVACSFGSQAMFSCCWDSPVADCNFLVTNLNDREQFSRTSLCQDQLTVFNQHHFTDICAVSHWIHTQRLNPRSPVNNSLNEWDEYVHNHPHVPLPEELSAPTQYLLLAPPELRSPVAMHVLSNIANITNRANT
jgi:hypothetical protein